jgi:hypothetical protein
MVPISAWAGSEAQGLLLTKEDIIEQECLVNLTSFV